MQGTQSKNMNQLTKNGLPKEILIVDDTPDNVRLLASMLTARGYKVRKALNGEMALTTCKINPPDLILLDIMMPDLNGYEVCLRLKANERTNKIPVIFISALDDVLDKVKAFAVGGVDYISKPFQSEEVLARVINQLTVQSLQQQLAEQNDILANLNKNLERLVEERTKQLINQEKTAAIGRLTQGLVHNLKNPLQTIMLTSSMLELDADYIDPESLSKYAQMITAAGNQMVQIMDNLLLKSYRDQTEELKLLDLNEIVRQELQLLNSNLDFKHHIEKCYSFDENLPKLPLIYSHISQVFNNLVANAIDSMWNRVKQELSIQTWQDEMNVYLEVQDTGCGIPANCLSRIFDPFYTSKPAKGEEKESGQPTGSGLGLYSCLELLKPFNGEIKVTSEVDRGSTFTVILPKPIITNFPNS